MNQNENNNLGNIQSKLILGARNSSDKLQGSDYLKFSNDANKEDSIHLKNNKNESVYSSLNATHNNQNGLSYNDSLMKMLRERDQTDIITEANRIMKERTKNLGSTLLSKPKSKQGYLQDCKEISLKNYLVDLLKDERTYMNDKELMITQAIKASENKLNLDYKNFLIFMDKEKQQLKNKDQEYLKYKNENDIIQLKEKKRIQKNKQILEEIEKVVRNIYTFKSYAFFIHNVVGIPFPFPHEPKNEFGYSDSKDKDKELELKVNKILKDFEGTNITTYTTKILDDNSILSSKFAELEEVVLKLIEKKHQTDKEVNGLNEKQKEEILELKKREIGLVKEKNKLVLELNKVKKHMNVLNYKNVDVDNLEHLKNIYSLYRVSFNSEYDTNNKTSSQLIKKKKDNEMNYIGELMDILKEKEELVFNLITEVEHMMKEDEGLVRDLIQKRKEKNKEMKQLANKLSKDEQNAIKRKKAVERSNRTVLKGRKTMEHHIISRGTKKVERKEDALKNDDVYWLIHYDEENH